MSREIREIPVVYGEQRPNGDLAVLCLHCRDGQSRKDVYHLHGGGPGSRSSHCWNRKSPFYGRNVLVLLREDAVRRLVEASWTEPQAPFVDRKEG